MNRIIRRVWWILLIAIIIIQFIPYSLPETNMDNPNDLFVNEQVPVDVGNIIRSACYDCHSNETQYPWYSYVAPVKFLIVRDIKKGRSDLNLSDWGKFKKKDKIKVLSEISKEVESGDMPFPAYKILHSEARLSDDQIKLLISWTEIFSEKIMGE